MSIKRTPRPARYPRSKGTPRYPRPKKPVTRADCFGSPRPCPWVSCRYHLYLDVDDCGRLKTNGDDPSTMKCSCALDEAERGGQKLESIRKIYDLSRERIRQIIEHALRKIRFQRGQK